MYEGGQAHSVCPRCGWAFHVPGDGDWLVTWIFAYTLGTLVMLAGIALLHRWTGLNLVTELIVCAGAGVLAVAGLFRQCKGAAAGLLYYLRVHWRE